MPARKSTPSEVPDLLDLAEELLDAQGDGRKLTTAEEAFLGRYSKHVYSEPARRPAPTMVEPGPEKGEVLRLRVQFGLQLWHPGDSPLAPVEEEEYDPLQSRGNFMTVGRVLRPLGDSA